jgi:glycosyltransferase involved in cell wall biosynthesis
MPQIIKSIDVALVPLKKLPLFEGAIPSKIFENLAMKKPILLGVEGEAFDLFIREGQAGLAFEPENFVDLKDKCVQIANNPKILNLYAENARSYVSKKFNREIIAKNFYQNLLQLTK